MGMRHGALLLAGVAAFLVGCGGAGMRAEAAGPQRLSFADLAGWNTDDQSAALAAFKRSCARIRKFSPSAALDTKGGDRLYGVAGDWQPACEAAMQVGDGAAAANARGFFQHWFVPVRFPSEKGLLTGYYEPEMKGALTRHGPYQTPVLAPPAGFRMVDGGVDFAALADIGDDDGGLASECFDFLANGVELVSLDIGQREVGAFLCKPQRNASSDPLASAGYQNDFAIQRHDSLLQKVGQSRAAGMFPFGQYSRSRTDYTR